MTFSLADYTMKEPWIRKRGKIFMKQKAPGRTLLLVTGIINVVIGLINTASGLINLSTVSQLRNGTLDAAMQQLYDSMGITADTLQFSAVIASVQGVIFLIAGIIGIVFGNKLKRSMICFGAGIVQIAMILIIAGINAAMGGFSVLTIISIVISLIVPVLYFWGAVKNRQADQENTGN